ncbi:MAG: type II toxin-antitoxin system RelE/ParE family toxin [Chloroflexi bacterium]|nr:type II toxin-antitoxin system RelE/ParE family toxin [Chloroflexota bacterium]
MVDSDAIEFRPEAREGLRRLGESDAQRVLDKIHWLSENSRTIRHEALTGEFKGLFKLRIGDYRVIYSIVRGQRIIAIHFIGHRRNIYERR